MDGRMKINFKALFSLLAVAILLLLAAVSICCAFMGAERASEVFNSFFAGACWCVLCALLLCAGVWNIVRGRRIFAAAMHIGCAAIIFGGLLGSERVCEWRGLSPVRGLAELRQGQAAKLGEISVKLQRLSAEYYPVEHSMLAWKIYFETTAPDGKTSLVPVQNVDDLPVAVKGFVIPGTEIMCETFDWIVSDSFKIPQLIWPGEACWEHEQLLKNHTINLVSGAIIHRTAKVEKFYDDLKLGTGAKAQDSGPAVSLVDSTGKTHYILSPGETVRLNRFAPDGRMLMYLPVNVNRGGRVSPFAAILVLRRGTEVMPCFTAARESDRHVRLSLESLYETENEWVTAGMPGLLFRLEQPEKQVFADCTFDGKANLRIAVNSPASYGGYDFTIVNYDLDRGGVGIFARCNCGILWVWSGFALLGAGITGWCVAGLLRRRGAAA